MESIELRNLRNQLKAAQLNVKHKREFLASIDYQLEHAQQFIEKYGYEVPRLSAEEEKKLSHMHIHNTNIAVVCLEYLDIPELEKRIKEIEDGI